ncbi:MAG: FkbM family methyltransferase [Caulobacteraceae bacterium]
MSDATVQPPSRLRRAVRFARAFLRGQISASHLASTVIRVTRFRQWGPRVLPRPVWQELMLPGGRHHEYLVYVQDLNIRLTLQLERLKDIEQYAADLRVQHDAEVETLHAHHAQALDDAYLQAEVQQRRLMEESEAQRRRVLVESERLLAALRTEQEGTRRAWAEETSGLLARLQADADARVESLRATLQAEHASQLAAALTDHQSALAGERTRHETELAALREQHDAATAATHAHYATQLGAASVEREAALAAMQQQAAGDIARIEAAAGAAVEQAEAARREAAAKVRESLVSVIHQLQEAQAQIILAHHGGEAAIAPRSPELNLEHMSAEEGLTFSGAFAEGVRSWASALRRRTEDLALASQGFFEALEGAVFELESPGPVSKALLEGWREGKSGAEMLRAMVASADPHLASRHARAVLPGLASQRAFPTSVRDRMPARINQFQIVDVGSEMLRYERDIYASLNDSWKCKAIGFDPFECAADGGSINVVRPDGLRVKTIPHLVGDGREVDFHINLTPATSSTLPANHALTRQFGLLDVSLREVENRRMPTSRLDDLLAEGGLFDDRIDFLKIDVQGATMDVLSNARQTLGRCLVVHVEAEFAEIYAGERLFAEADQLLRLEGFDFVDFHALGRMPYSAFDGAGSQKFHRGRMLWADAIYVRGLDGREMLAGDDLLRVAVIMHEIYNKQDVAAELLARYDHAVNGDLAALYLDGGS